MLEESTGTEESAREIESRGVAEVDPESTGTEEVAVTKLVKTSPAEVEEAISMELVEIIAELTDLSETIVGLTAPLEEIVETLETRRGGSLESVKESTAIAGSTEPAELSVAAMTGPAEPLREEE